MLLPIFSKYNSWQFLFHCKGNRTVGKDAAAKQQPCRSYLSTGTKLAGTEHQQLSRLGKRPGTDKPRRIVGIAGAVGVAHGTGHKRCVYDGAELFDRKALPRIEILP